MTMKLRLVPRAALIARTLPVLRATVSGGDGIAVVYGGGEYTASLDLAGLSALASIAASDQDNIFFLAYNSDTNIYGRAPLSVVLDSLLLDAYRLVTAAGAVTVGTADRIILLNKTIGEATDINLPTSVSRNGVPVTVKDLRGDAATNRIRFVMSGSETLDGFPQTAADANFASIIDSNYGKRTVYPLTSGGWYL